jgi:cytochrome P450
LNVDLLSPETFNQGHPHEVYTWLRDNAPVYWHEEPDGPGFWVVTRYAEVAGVGREPRTYSSEPTIMIADPVTSGMDFGGRKMMLMMDPPQHTQFRKIISREFTRGPAAALKPRIHELAGQIVDRVIGKGECDFVTDIAGELPSYVIAELMGIPLSDGRKLYELTEILHSAPQAVAEGAQAKAAMEMFAYASGVYRTKLDNPTDDLASQIVAAEVDGYKLDEMDFQLFFMLLIDAGGDTTRNLLSVGMLQLLADPQTFETIAATPDLVPNLRDEMLRWVSPVIYMRRTVIKDTVLADQQLKAGDKLVRYFGSANFDDRVFKDPHTFNIYRKPNEHIAFGTGTHVCLGQHIARAEIDTMLAELLARITNLRQLAKEEWLASNFISGVTTLPIAFDRR